MIDAQYNSAAEPLRFWSSHRLHTLMPLTCFTATPNVTLALFTPVYFPRKHMNLDPRSLVMHTFGRAQTAVTES